MTTDQTSQVAAFTGFFALGVYGAVTATKQSRAGRPVLAFMLAVLAAILMIIPGMALLIAAAWLL